MCHSELGAARGLRLDTYDLARAGGINGPVLIPADASNSELIRRLRGESLPRMPFLGRPLSPEQIDLIVRWVDAGLPNSVGNATAPVGADETSHLQQEIAPPRAPFTTP
jgi:hypothetical protein